ncbi:E3 ubiquitin-protein ligase RNF168, partial [Colius striatus]
EAPLSLCDCLCQICMEILVEPVTLPCNHTLCNSCFQLTVEKASLCCPFCRRRVSSWARYNARRNTLVNWELWEKIQKSYPKECESRISGQDLEKEICVPRPPQHQLSKPGELRQEYEAEINKVKAERQAHEQEENKASEEYIQRLLAEEEEEEQRLAEERRKEMEKQLKQDEELAWQLSNSLNEDSKGQVLCSPSAAGSLSPQTSPAQLGKARNRASSSGDIQKYLSPKPQRTFGSASFSRAAQRGRSDPGSAEPSSEGSSSAWWGEHEEMPILSPQLIRGVQGSSAKDLFFESCMNYFSASGAGETATSEQEEAAGPTHPGGEAPDALGGIAGEEESRGVLQPCEGEGDGAEAGTRAGEKAKGLQDTKEPPKRKSLEPPAEAAIDMCALDKRRRTFPEALEDQGEQVGDFNVQMQKAFEQEFYERRQQEEQDRLLALQLQKQLNEESTLNRQKGSPDEYLLRTQRPQAGKNSLAQKGTSKTAKDSKVPKKQAEAHARKARKGSCDENWQSPTRVHVKSPGTKGGKVLNCVVNTSDTSDICSLPKAQQKTLLQMFKSPV